MKLSLTTILLASDGSLDAAEAARAAIALADQAGAALHVVHAWRVPEEHADPALPAHDRAYAAGRYEQRGRDTLAAALAQIASAGGAVASAQLRHGRPVGEILSEAELVGADLIVTGSRGFGPAKRVLLGSVAEGIVRGAACPVLTVRGGEGAWPPARLIVGDDGSEEARRAGDLAAAIGGAVGAAGLIVRAVPPLPHEAVTAGALPDQDAARLNARVLDRVEQALAARADELAVSLGHRPETRATVEDPEIALLRAAEERDTPALIAVGTRGTGAAGQLWLGSVAIRVLTCASGSVLIYPHRAVTAPGWPSP